MLVFRSLTLGLLGACAMLLALRPAPHVHVVAQLPATTVLSASPMASVPYRSTPPPTIINIATKPCHLGSGLFETCFATDLVPLLKLAPDERVSTINDQSVDTTAFEELARKRDVTLHEADTRDAALAIALWQAPMERGRYLDLAVTSERGERRVLVLMH